MRSATPRVRFYYYYYVWRFGKHFLGYSPPKTEKNTVQYEEEKKKIRKR